METSGCLLVAFAKPTAARLKQAFATKTTKKTYLALVHGDAPWDQEYAIDLPIGLVDPDQPITIRMTVRSDAPPATTLVKVLQRPAPGYTLVQCKPISGRQHQIRAHLAALGYPIVGDKLYGHGDDAFREFCDSGFTAESLRKFELPRHALHAAELTFPHPSKGMMTVRCPMPEDLQAFIDRGCVMDEAQDEDAWLSDLLAE
jgi:23S rRNA pseudouridine1911/1915/1917 synthase